MSTVPAAPDFVVLGDLNLDWSLEGELALRFADLRANGVIAWAPLAEKPGGSGLNFAAFARRAGYRVMLIGTVGDDLAGRGLREWLAAREIQAAVGVRAEAETGRAVILRDAGGIRLLVNSAANANALLTAEEVESCRPAIAGCRVLYVSGYCIQHPDAPRHRAALRAMSLARERAGDGGPRIVFDVVPHRIYETYDYARLRDLTRPVGVLIAEVATMRRLLGLGSREERIDRALAEETLAALQGDYPGCILRYGFSGCDEQLLWDARDGRVHWEETGHDRAPDKRGFGDLLAIRALREFFAFL